MRIGLIHPGSMGAAVGAAARAAGARVGWASAGRSEATVDRARSAALDDDGSLDVLVRNSDALLSICPPHAAVAVARQAVAAGFTGIYVDANAVAPATARTVGAIVQEAGAAFVDAGIIGPPPHEHGTTRLYLAGAEASTIASVFTGTALQTVVLDQPAGAASAVKTCFAAYSKGVTALVLAIRSLAAAEGVQEALLAEWRAGVPGLVERSSQTAVRAAPKAWRFAGEMDEIAQAFAAAGLPDGFHQAASALYDRLARFKGAAQPDIEAVLAALAQPAESPSGHTERTG